MRGEGRWGGSGDGDGEMVEEKVKSELDFTVHIILHIPYFNPAVILEAR